MNREELIKKWLDNELSSHEFEAFKQLEDYESLVKISNGVKQIKVPEYNTEEELQTVLQRIHVQKPQQRTRWTTHLVRIAAVVILSFSVYYYTTTLDTNITTLVAQKTTLELPDASQVSLNAMTNLTFNKKDWKNNRDVELDGEAYFRVAKGSTFSVNTSAGTISVLGTEFNVKHRDNLFEVICYEGSVRVSHNANTSVLKPGDSFLIIDGKIIAKEKETNLNPSWINNQSYFKSMSLDFVLKEFKRQYNITITTEHLDLQQLFTGNFVHDNKELALKSITLPLNLKYSILDDASIVITRE